MAIDFKNVSFKYNEFSEKNIIEDINIELDDNIIYGLIGKSGSGKTTLLELIDGLLKIIKQLNAFDKEVVNTANEIYSDFIINKKWDRL